MNSALPAHDTPTPGESEACACYHCGEDVPPGVNITLEIGGEARPMCCPGCRAVASLIAGSGLERFYEQRTAFNERPVDEAASSRDTFSVYDDPTLLAQYTNETDTPGVLDLRLLVGGITCAACTWLIETSLARLPGVKGVSLNLAQSRLDLRIDTRVTPPSRIFERVTALGYRAQPWHSSAEQQQVAAEHRRDLRRLAVAGFGMMQVGMFAIALHAGAIQGIAEEYQDLLRLVSLLVTGLIVLFSARGFFESAWRHLRQGALVMDLPVALAIGIAYGASAVATLTGTGDVYFDSVVMFTFFLLLARFIEKRLRYRDSLAFRDAEQALPDAVLALSGGSWRRIPRSSIASGQQLRVRAGETVPVDGVVLTGSSTVREDSFSGEALPRAVSSGDDVFAGTVNGDATLELAARGSYAESRLAALQRSIDRARLDKPAVARLADRLASRFIAAVLLATLATAVAWFAIDADRALWVALSVLVISCPCALSLATPASLASAAARLRRLGVIVYGENALEGLAATTHALFDKTGTLTTAAFRCDATVRLDDRISAQQCVALATALQSHANHPIATAFASEKVRADLVSDATYQVGAGIEGCWEGRRLRMGSGTFCRDIAATLPPHPQRDAYWVALVAENQPLMWFGLVDDLREEAATVIAALERQGVTCELVTGDASERGRQIGASLGLQTIHAGMSPQDKLARVRDLQAEGATVTMIGDGLNDAPVLTQANTSIAVAGATDLARAQADFVIERGDLRRVLDLFDTARATRRVIAQNFAWALGYNALGIPLAACGWIPPWAAALGMSASSLIVISNAARLRRL
jgi:Cu2+-exporting ATPase